MATATVTSKGQLTIPKEVREAVGLKAGDQVVVVIEDERIALYPVRRGHLTDLRGVFASRMPFPGRDAERDAAMQEATREAIREALPEMHG